MLPLLPRWFVVGLLFAISPITVTVADDAPALGLSRLLDVLSFPR